MGRDLDQENHYASIPLVVDTSKFSEKDFELFLESSEIIEKSQEKRNSFRRSRSNRSFTCSSREELFEVSEVDDNEYLEIASNAYNDIDVNIRNLSADIEKLFENLVEEDDVCKSGDGQSVIDERKKMRQRAIVEKKGAHAKSLLEKQNNQDPFPENKPVREKPIATYKPTSKISVVVSSTPNTKHHVVESGVEVQVQQFERSSKQGIEITSVKEKVSFFNQLTTNLGMNRTKVSITSKQSFEKRTAVYRNIIADNKEKTPAKEPERLPREQCFVKNRIKQFELAKVTENRAEQTSTFTHSNSLEPLVSVSDEKLVSKMRSYFEKSQHTLVERTQFDTRAQNESTLRCDSSRNIKTCTSVKNQQMHTKQVTQKIEKIEKSTDKQRESSRSAQTPTINTECRNLYETWMNMQRGTSTIPTKHRSYPAKSKFHAACTSQPKASYNPGANFSKKPCDSSRNLAKPKRQPKIPSHAHESASLELRKRLCQDPAKHETCQILPKTKYNSKQDVPPRSNLTNDKPNPQELIKDNTKRNAWYDPKEGISDYLQKRIPSCTSLSSASSLPPCVRTVDYLKSGSTSNATSTKTTPEKYNAFVESEKSLKKLSDIVRTIRKVRDQGMTEISRDLFHMFKESLKSASSKLNHSTNKELTSPSKRIALVKPSITTSPKSTRALDAISKSREIKQAARRPSARLNPYKLSADLLDDSELTYEGFVASLQTQ